MNTSILKKLYKYSDYRDKFGMIFNTDCMELMSNIKQVGVFDLTVTDIPYDMVTRPDNGLRNLDKSHADILTFNLNDFLNEIYRLTKGTIIIFCGVNQVSQIYKFFEPKAKSKEGTIREIIWHKTNPSPMNGQYVYLNSIEYAVWFRKRGATFNAHCKHNVLNYPTGRSKIHPTEKNHELIKDLILDNSNEGDIIFDPCAGSLAHCLVAKENGRRYVGCELNKEYFDKGVERLSK